MQYLPRFALLLFVSLAYVTNAYTQQAFTEGVITYSITMDQAAAATQEYSGTFTCTIKPGQLRKDIKLSNGYADVVIINTNTNIAYSLQNTGNKKYAIQLDMNEVAKKHKQFEGFSVQKVNGNTKQIAGQNAEKAIVTYRDGTSIEAYFSTAWYPAYDKMFDRMPGVKMMPLEFDFLTDKGIRLHLKAEKIASVPVANNQFRIPPAYKIITYEEYRKMQQR